MNNMKDLVIIGGGPGGLAAGIYAARADLKTVLLEKGMPGGLAATTEFIENYPGFPEGISGPELAMNMENQARRFGLEVVNDYVEKFEPKEKYFLVKTSSKEIQAKAVILATGASPQMLGVRGEDEMHGRGVSYCATCDGAFFRGKKVAVVGGGDAAVEEALFLTKFAEEVYIIHRRGELRAAKIIQQRAKENPKIKFIWHSVVEEIIGSTVVEGVKLKDVRTNEINNLQVNGVFVYVGTRPSSELIKDLVDTDERGYVLADENMRTSYPGIFAIGDVRQKSLRQVVTAVADGAIAAVAVEKYLEEL